MKQQQDDITLYEGDNRLDVAMLPISGMLPRITEVSCDGTPILGQLVYLFGKSYQASATVYNPSNIEQNIVVTAHVGGTAKDIPFYPPNVSTPPQIVNLGPGQRYTFNFTLNIPYLDRTVLGAVYFFSSPPLPSNYYQQLGWNVREYSEMMIELPIIDSVQLATTNQIWELSVGAGSIHGHGHHFRFLSIPFYGVQINGGTKEDLAIGLRDSRVRFFWGNAHGSGDTAYVSLTDPGVAWTSETIALYLKDRPPINVSVTQHCGACSPNQTWAEALTKGFQPKCISLATGYGREETGESSTTAASRVIKLVTENPAMTFFEAYLQAVEYYGLPYPVEYNKECLGFYGDETTKLEDIL